jgi:hypothetical protein
MKAKPGPVLKLDLSKVTRPVEQHMRVGVEVSFFRLHFAWFHYSGKWRTTETGRVYNSALRFEKGSSETITRGGRLSVVSTLFHIARQICSFKSRTLQGCVILSLHWRGQCICSESIERSLLDF